MAAQFVCVYITRKRSFCSNHNNDFTLVLIACIELACLLILYRLTACLQLDQTVNRGNLMTAADLLGEFGADAGPVHADIWDGKEENDEDVWNRFVEKHNFVDEEELLLSEPLCSTLTSEGSPVNILTTLEGDEMNLNMKEVIGRNRVLKQGVGMKGHRLQALGGGEMILKMKEVIGWNRVLSNGWG